MSRRSTDNDSVYSMMCPRKKNMFVKRKDNKF